MELGNLVLNKILNGNKRYKMNRLIQYKIILITLLTFCFLPSCTREADPINSTDEPGSLCISFSIEGVDTRVEADVFETEIKEAVLIFYNPKDDSFVDYLLLTPRSSEDRRFDLTFPSYFKAGEEYKVLVFANYSPYSTDGVDDLLNAGYSYEQMRENMTAHLIDDSYIVAPLPYTGKLIDYNEVENVLTVPGHDPSEGKLDYRVVFKRIVSRIDLLNKVPNKLNIQWAKLVNYRSQSYMYSDLLTGQIIRNRETNPNSLGVAKPYDEIVDGQIFTQQISGQLYCFTNVTELSSVGDNESTALLICGYYGDSDTPSYYRINIVSQYGRQALKQNTAYVITIRDVHSVGARNEEEAMNEEWALIDYDFGNDWINKGFYIVTDDRGNYTCVSSNFVELDNGPNMEALVHVDVNSEANWDVVFKESDREFNKLYTLTKNKNSFVIKANSQNENESREFSLLVKNSENSKLIKEVKVKQIRLDQYLFKVGEYTDDFTLTVNQKTETEIELEVRVGENSSMEWYCKIGKNSDSNYYLLKNWGHDKDKILLKRREHIPATGQMFIEVYREDGKKIVMSLDLYYR